MSKGGKSKSLRLAILEQMAVLAAGGFGLVAALAWNDAIQALLTTGGDEAVAQAIQKAMSSPS